MRCICDPRGQAHPRDRGRQPAQHRVLRRRAGAARRGRGAPDELRPRALDVRARGEAPPEQPDVLELDVNEQDHFDALRDELRERWGGSTAPCTRSLLRPRTRSEASSSTRRARALPQRSRPARSRSRRWRRHCFRCMRTEASREVGASSGSTSTPPGRGPRTTGWASRRRRSRRRRATSRATSVRTGCGVNLVSAGPLATPAASGIPGFSRLKDLWEAQAPLGWDVRDPTPVAQAIAFLLSDMSRGISGEILHVDEEFHAMGAPLSDEVATSESSRASS